MCSWWRGPRWCWWTQSWMEAASEEVEPPCPTRTCLTHPPAPVKGRSWSWGPLGPVCSLAWPWPIRTCLVLQAQRRLHLLVSGGCTRASEKGQLPLRDIRQQEPPDIKLGYASFCQVGPYDPISDFLTELEISVNPWSNSQRQVRKGASGQQFVVDLLEFAFGNPPVSGKGDPGPRVWDWICPTPFSFPFRNRWREVCKTHSQAPTAPSSSYHHCYYSKMVVVIITPLPRSQYPYWHFMLSLFLMAFIFSLEAWCYAWIITYFNGTNLH